MRVMAITRGKVFDVKMVRSGNPTVVYSAIKRRKIFIVYTVLLRVKYKQSNENASTGLNQVTFGSIFWS